VAVEQAGDAGGAGARLSAVPLRYNRDFVLLPTGQTLSTIGSESTAIAYPLLVLALTHSPAQAGIVGFARIVPWALFGFPVGVIADRADRKRIMVLSDVVRAVEQARWSTVALIAPPLGGALFGLGRALPFVANGLSYSFSLVSLLAMRTPFQEAREKDDTPAMQQLAEGFHWLWSHRFFRACALLFSWTNLVFEALFLVLIVAGRREGLSSGAIGGLIAVFGVCSLLGSVLAPRLTRLISMRTMVIGSFWVQLGFAAYLVKPSVYVLLAGSIPMALFIPSVNAAVIGYRTAVVPDRLTGRVGGVARTIALCTAAFGPLSAGLLLDSLSVRQTVAVYAALMLLLCVLASLNSAIRNAPSLSDLDVLPIRSASHAEGG
jgi:MFS family permease